MFNIGKTSTFSAQNTNTSRSESTAKNSGNKAFTSATSGVSNKYLSSANIKVTGSSNVRIGNTYYGQTSSSGSGKNSSSAAKNAKDFHSTFQQAFKNLKTDKGGSIVISGKSNIHIGKNITTNPKK